MNKVKAFINQKKQAFQVLSQQNKFFQPGIIVVVVLLAGVGVYIIIRTFAATGPQTVNFAPTDDAFVNKGAPNANYGSATNLSVVGGTGRKDSLLKFTVANLPAGKITGATLWLYVTNGSGNGGNVYLADPNWSQNSVTWAAKPALVGTPTTGAAFSENAATKPTTTTAYAVIGKAGTVTAGYWKQVNVGSVVKSNGTYSFRVITGSTNNAVYASKESAHPPKLAVTVDVAADTTPPTAPVLSGYPVSGTIFDAIWTPSTDNVGVSYYKLFKSDGTLLVDFSQQPDPASITYFRSSGGYSFYAVAYDAAGNASAPSNTITSVINPVDPTDRNYTTPEGTTIEIDTKSGFTYDSIYKLLKDNAYPGDYATIAKTFTINVQDIYPSSVSYHCDFVGGVTSFHASMYLSGVNSGFSVAPDSTMAHEYGHVWTLYHLCIDQKSSWTNYYNTRWDNADGSLTLGQDSRLGTAYEWTNSEIIADDYRLLFGDPMASAARNHLNTILPDPRVQPDLKDWLLNVWAVKQP